MFTGPVDETGAEVAVVLRQVYDAVHRHDEWITGNAGAGLLFGKVATARRIDRNCPRRNSTSSASGRFSVINCVQSWRCPRHQ